MKQAFHFLKQIRKNGHQDISISFNISVIQLLREDFIDNLKALMVQEAVEPGNLKIELTETVFSDHFKQINSKLEELKNMGIKIALDDFGTGYSSLARERELNIDYMKIDKFFIDKLLGENTEAEITGDIISMAHKLGHYVIAEGVEYEEQEYYLAGHDCDFIQGYLYGKPLSDNTIELLQKQPSNEI
jgi:FOG: EAL domain